ncbi:MAG: hypothetical protein ACI4RG_09350 [Huintestinicola sp.]
MFGQNKDDDGFISLDKEDYPEIYPGKDDGEIYPDKRVEPVNPYADFSAYPAAYEGDGALADYLFGDERILWSGKGSMSGKQSKGMELMFAVIWTLFSVVWTVAVSFASKAMALFGVPFILIGIGLFVSMFKKPAVINYAVTNKRILYQQGKSFKAEYLDLITDAMVFQTGKETADVKFYVQFNGMSGSASTTDGSFVLYGLGKSEAESVCRLILSESAREKANRR